MDLFFDTETSDKYDFNSPPSAKHQPWIVQVGCILSDAQCKYAEVNLIVQPNGRKIEEGAKAVHNISEETAEKVGVDESIMLEVVYELLLAADTIVCHNTDFDLKVLGGVWTRSGADPDIFNEALYDKCIFCTMKQTTELLKLPGRYGRYKWPKLSELYRFLFNEDIKGAHDAMYDVRATRECYYELERRKMQEKG